MKKMLLSSTLVVSLAAFGGSLAYAQGGQRGGPQRPSFSQIDANGDGALTMDEFLSQGRAKFDKTDANGDGQLDVAELTAAAERERARMIERLMTRKDANGDGMLSYAEMQPHTPGRVFERADTDGNGEISQAEWDAAKEKMHRPQVGN